MKRYANMRLLAAVALLVATAGCKDDEGPALKQPALLSIQDTAADAEVITVESPKKQTLNIRVEGEQISSNYITVVFKIDPELVETYNAAHGTSYKLCPSEAYEFSTAEVMLPRYNTLSSTMKVELFSERMPDEEPYLLPIAIDSIKGDPRATVSPTGNVRYILFNKLVKPGPPAPVLLERSGWKVLAAPKAKPNYEVEKMFDEDINTFGYCNADEEERSCAVIMDACLERLRQEKQLELIAALLSGDRRTFELFRCQAPELQHLPAATYEWYSKNYLDRDYPIRMLMKCRGIRFPEHIPGNESK